MDGQEEERRSLEEKLAQVDQQSMKKDSSIHAQYTTLVDQHQNILREKAHVDSQLGQYQVQVTTLQRDMDQMISKYQRLVAQLTAATPSQPDDIQAKLVEKEELTDLLQRTQMDRGWFRWALLSFIRPAKQWLPDHLLLPENNQLVLRNFCLYP